MTVERRTVLQAGGLIAFGGIVAACSSTDVSTVASSLPASAPASAAPESSVAAGSALAAVADIPVGGGLISADPPVVITQPTSGDVKSFSAICTHEGCLVGSVVDNEIICPCHGATFSATDGSVMQGPAQAPLAEEVVVVDASGNVMLSA